MHITLIEQNRDQGFALIAALLLIVVVGIVATSVLQTTSTEMKISGNQRQAVQDFYAAEAGLAEGLARLRNRAGSENIFIYDPTQSHNPLWSAYILTASTWSLNNDPNFSSLYLNVIPLQGNPSNTLVQPNSVQSTTSYWVKVRHKTEYDAEQNGHSPSTPHYFDGDGSRSKHRSSNVGNVIYYGYPSSDDIVPQQFTTQGPTPWLPVELISSHGGTHGSGRLLEAEVIHPVGPNPLAAVYAEGAVTLSGQSGTINGHDACGVAPSISPVNSGNPVTQGPAYQFDGIPAIPVQEKVALNLVQSITDLSRGVVPIQSDLVNQQLGKPSVSDSYLANGSELPNPSRILIQNTAGQGILMVNGTAVLKGQVSWNGMVIVTGDLIVQGEETTLTVNGAVWSKNFQQTGGLLNIHYDSCQIKSALLSQPVLVRSWKEEY